MQLPTAELAHCPNIRVISTVFIVYGNNYPQYRGHKRTFLFYKILLPSIGHTADECCGFYAF